ncbi:AraC-like DNA-binding protein [Nocardia tenerifensis]|uniref:HTH-type transcriptional regulator RipA n=1 Tax=Nocardia tenerifensis TaxID=228006 RepID=A0A318JZI3_9NOCA|nr:helix-turn-helix transcriptional regulator [Nocardia tenerifensis]PXX61068.1 AraC-like DNA-binding protein [Nocardia tenerifensis]
MPETCPTPPELDVAMKRGRMGHGTHIAMHRHREGQLLYPSAGVLATTTELGTWVAPADRLTWTPPGFEHSHRAYGDTEIHVLEVPRALSGDLPDEPTVFAVTPLLREALVALTTARPFQPGARDRLRRVVIDELTHIPDHSVYLPEPRDDRLRAATAQLHVDPATSATLAELGREVGASERTLSRLFHAELGMSFHQWRTLLRVQHALVHLLDGRSVTSTALACGWSNPTSFIEAFTALVGQTPGRYQSELRQRAR